MKIRSRAPARVDFAGGWTDVAAFCLEEPGFVLNAAVNLYSYVTVYPLPDIPTKEYGYKHLKSNNGIKIYSADFDEYMEAESIKELEYKGSMDLIIAATKKYNIAGIELVTRSTAPAGSGLGSSAAMGVALCGALSAYENPLSALPIEMAEMACNIEKELCILGGKQDQYASALGGFNALEFRGKNVKSYRMPLAESVMLELEKSLVLCYTGKSRLSGNIHWCVQEAYKEKRGEVRTAIGNLKSIAAEMYSELCSSSLRNFGALMGENWKWQKKLSPSITNSDMDALYSLARRNGAMGGKACGAGGGGCMIFYCPGAEHTLRAALQQENIQIIDFSFDDKGLQIWETK